MSADGDVTVFPQSGQRAIGTLSPSASPITSCENGKWKLSSVADRRKKMGYNRDGPGVRP
jgi:hypothetical protein